MTFPFIPTDPVSELMLRPRRRAIAGRMLDRLRNGGDVVAKVVVVAAHPDDETIGIGAQLCRLRDALIVQLTDGAPRDGHDAAMHGFASIDDYARAREAELACALREGGAERVAVERLGIADQECCLVLAQLARTLAALWESVRPDVVVVQPYEGGHPDHDAASFAVHAAGRLLARRKRRTPAIVEMASYHAAGGVFRSAKFLLSRQPVTTIALSPEDIARKRRMIACFASQRSVLAAFDIAIERFRETAGYDFREPPHAGTLHYETLGWSITGAIWRAQARRALADLDLLRTR